MGFKVAHSGRLISARVARLGEANKGEHFTPRDHPDPDDDGLNWIDAQPRGDIDLSFTPRLPIAAFSNGV